MIILFFIPSVNAEVIESICAKIYTTNSDFDEGELFGLEHDTIHDQLQLSQTAFVLPYIWIPNQNSTVSKVNIHNGNEIARYKTVPDGVDGGPSRGTVDIEGNCWLANRLAGSVIKIGLFETNKCVDRNFDGVISTSTDLDGDGDITGSEILPFGEDECVLYEVILIPAKEGTYTPSTYTGGYTNDWGIPGPRSLAIDSNNNLWAGCYGSQKFYVIDGHTGIIEESFDVDSHPYGALIDSNGLLWSSNYLDINTSAVSHVLIIDTTSKPYNISKVELQQQTYGLGLDYDGFLYVNGYLTKKLSKINTINKTVEWTYSKNELNQGRGVAVTPDNNVWAVSSANGKVYRYDSNGNLLTSNGISVGNDPNGVAVDSEGKVWVCNRGDEYIKRIDPSTNAIDLSKQIIGSNGHYSYGDMTGIVSGSITTKKGVWSVVYDSESKDTFWKKVKWTAKLTENSNILVKVRSSNNKVDWSNWINVTNGLLISENLSGQYIEIELTMQILKGNESPILYDLCIETETNQCTLTGDLFGQVHIDFSDTKVMILETGQTTYADKDGNYILTNIPVGKYTLLIEKDNYVSLTLRHVYIENGELQIIPNYKLISDSIDSDNNNKINIIDAIHALKIVSGIE